MKTTYDREQMIPFTDDFIFGMVMQNEEVCSGVLNMILPEGGFDTQAAHRKKFRRILKRFMRISTTRNVRRANL